MNINFKSMSYAYSKNSPFVLDSINWECFPSEIIGLIGENGSGKSTLLRLLGGLLRPSTGSIIVGGQRVKGSTSIRDSVCYVPENAKLFLLGPTLEKDSRRISPDYDLDKQFELSILMKIKDEKLYSLSEGQRRLCAIWLAFQLKRNIILLDEPTIGMDIQGKRLFSQLLQKASSQGKIVIIASNDARIFPLLSRVTVLHKSKIILDGSPNSILYQLEKVPNLIPNQLVLVISELRKRGYNIPSFVLVKDFNNYLQKFARRKT
ncbi:MAG: ATP-binding cassette domain-containing protein [Candidatus Hodarchaeales archaeon]